MSSASEGFAPKTPNFRPSDFITCPPLEKILRAPISEEETSRGKSMDPVSAALPGIDFGMRHVSRCAFLVCTELGYSPLPLPSASRYPHVRSRCCFSYLTDSQPSYPDDWQQPSTLHVRDALRSVCSRPPRVICLAGLPGLTAGVA